MIAKTQKFTYTIIIIAAIAGILYGYDLGIIAGVFLFVQKDLGLNTDQVSLLASAVLGGGALATLISGPLADWLGRRILITISSVIFLVGTFGLYLAHNFDMLLIGRLLQGIGVGVVTIVIPLYLAESVPSRIRGRGVSMFQLMLTLGILLATLVDLAFTKSGNWRAMFLSAAVPGFILFIGCFVLPNSPRWLSLKGRFDEAYRVLRRSRSKKEADHEIEQMRASLKNVVSHKKKNRSSVFKRAYMFPFFVVLAVAILQQLSGVNSILQYSALILKDSGLHSNIAAIMGSNFITSLNFVVTIIAIILVDKVGRRSLLRFGTAVMVIALVACAMVYHFFPLGDFKGYLLLGGILLFILGYAIGPGVVVWLVLSELLPSRIRSVGMAIGLFMNSFASAVFSDVFLKLVHHIGYSGIFVFSAAACLLYFFVALLYIPEAKNKSLEEIEQAFQN